MAQVGGFLSALGQAFSGYGQDKQIKFQREQELAKMAMAQQSAGDAHLDALLARATNYPMMSGNASSAAPWVSPGVPQPSQGTPPAMPQQPPTPMVRRGDGFAPAPGSQPTPQAPQSPAPQTPSPTDFMGGLPTDAVDVPGYGQIDRYGGLKKQLMMKKLESDIDADSKVSVASRTGEVAKNAASANLDTRNANEIKPGDPGYIDYMSTLDASKARATLPVEMQKMVAQGQISLGNALVEEDAKAKNARTLQGSQQQFEQGQQGRQQTFEQGQQAGAFVNSSALENQNHRSSMFGRITAVPAQTNAPSAKPRLTAEQLKRAATDPLYAKFLQTKSF